MRSETLGRSSEVASEERNLHQIRLLCVLGEITDLHVLEHALTKLCHG